MSDLYNHDGHKFADAGLQLRTPVDLVPPNQYSKLTNAIPVIEGRLEGRAGLSWIVKGSPASPLISPETGLHSLIRLNAPYLTASGDRVAGVDGTVVTFALPAGTTGTTQDQARTADPLSMPQFHFAADVAPWQIIADRSGMFKYKSGLYQGLGIQPPMAPFASNGYLAGAATAIDGGAGNLNSTGGNGYDWVYTFVNTKTQSESNPSSVLWSATEVSSPATLTAPDTGFGGAAGAGPAPQLVVSGNSVAELRQSGKLSAFVAATSAYQLLYLQIGGNLTITGGDFGGLAYGAIYMSLDSGSSWKLLLDSSVTRSFFSTSQPPLIYVLPITQDLTKIQIRAVAFGVGNTTIPQNVTARRVRGYGGNFSIAPLLTGGGGNAAITITMQPATFGVPLTATPTTLALVNRQATVTVRNPFDTQVDAIRLYRRGGSITAGWAFVSQFNVTAHDGSTFTVTDNIADTNLGSFVSLTNDAPVTSVYMQQRFIPYVWGPGFNPARLFGCGDPDRPGAVYFSNPGNADQWGIGQWLDVSNASDPMQNGCVFNTRVFAFSMERMYELAPSLIGGTTFTPFQTPCSRGLISPWGLLATARAIYFIAKDGIYMTTGGEEQSLIENNIKPLFPTLDNPTGRQVEGYDAVDMERIEDMRLKFHNDELYFIYRGVNEGTLQMLVYDQNKNRWRAASYPASTPIVTVYSEEGTQSSLLLGDTSGNMYSTIGTGQGDVLQAGALQNITVTIRTGAYDQGMPLSQKEYGNVIFDIDPGGATVANPVTITPLLNGEVITEAAITVTGTGRQQVPLTLGDVFGFNIEFNISFIKNATINPVLYQFDVLWRTEPVAVTHWEARETSNGLPGWQHIRDMYITLRSNTTVTLTCTFDGNYTQTYTLASTTGARKKVYVPFNSNKFKLVRYSLDSTDVTQPFRIYESDLEVRVKPWLTGLGYAIVKPFGGETTQAPEAIAAQLLGGK